MMPLQDQLVCSSIDALSNPPLVIPMATLSQVSASSRRATQPILNTQVLPKNPGDMETLLKDSFSYLMMMFRLFNLKLLKFQNLEWEV